MFTELAQLIITTRAIASGLNRTQSEEVWALIYKGGDTPIYSLNAWNVDNAIAQIKQQYSLDGD